jgi:ATP-binding protein involved in chromosome partitioning
MACPHCGGHIDVFGSGGGRRLAESVGVPFLGVVPLDPAVVTAGDEGRPTVLSSSDSPAGLALADIAEAILERLAEPRPADA